MCPSSEPKDDKASPRKDDDDDDDDDDFFIGANFLFGSIHDEYNIGEDSNINISSKNEYTNGNLSMTDAMLRLKQCEGHDDNTAKDYRERTCIVQAQMGTQTLCRGRRGEELRQSGAIDALLSTLAQVYGNLPPPISEDMNDESKQAIILATACWGAIRDLSCHNASVRSEVRIFIICGNDDDCSDDATTGLQLMARYLAFYDSTSWQDLVDHGQVHLKLLTSVIGALRNVTHSTGENCVQLHNYGVTSLLSWRLLHAGPSLPDVTQPWREAAFRSGATLINMAEKCPECAVECARNVTLLHILIECWGGKACNSMKAAPMLHLGLAAILQAAKQELSEEDYSQSWKDILLNEEKRKQKAKRREAERKQCVG